LLQVSCPPSSLWRAQLTMVVEVILSKVDPLMLQKLYNIPPYNDVRDFLIRIALTRGRLGKVSIS
jgi:nuclear GTP-binding protein